MWVVVYAKVIDDKDDGIKLAGVYFGGTAASKHDAEMIARDCVNTIKGGTIMPKIYESNGQRDLPRIMREAEQTFRQKAHDMATAAAIIQRSAKRK